MYGLGFTLASDAPFVVRSPGDVYTEVMDASGDYQGSVGTPGNAGFTWWLNQNAGKVAIGAGLLFLFVGISRR
jgi:hypothetical protein